ncbi:hypothetical protein LVD17_23975 [Fulvivirga ulvae]|uniref:hypothetical protein n=1 Tax=Fulvivirga ulvae TaxID=2904245 RepID=UPI001F31A67A|nr:hypothetical protein [Fulvivirga ulvae]UII31355.1 hypothetical protein LVD17_23975 [Fulvivirga ulvae]
MSTQNGPNVCFNHKHSTECYDPSIYSTKISKSSEEEFFNSIKCQGIEELIDSLKMVHDFALYHTDLPLDATEKMALFNLKILWESMEKLVRC